MKDLIATSTHLSCITVQSKSFCSFFQNLRAGPRCLPKIVSTAQTDKHLPSGECVCCQNADTIMYMYCSDVPIIGSAI